MLATAPISSIPQLDNLFDRIGVKLQLSSTAYNLASERYQSVASWLNDTNSGLYRFHPRIYPQGSLNLGTTTKPVGRSEYDLDFVCEFQMAPEACLDPIILLDLLETRLRENSTYNGMIERLNRCIRLIYKNDFHLDILPGCLNPTSGPFGATCILVPDSAARCWKDSNPLGFAEWFKLTAEQAYISFREKSVKPLPEQQSYAELNILQRVVQLVKRYRDMSLKSLDQCDHPISIVLTTLAAKYYSGNTSIIYALLSILESISAEIERTAGRLVVLNPTNSDEDLSEKWENHPERYKIFINWIRNFRQDLLEIMDIRGLYRIETKLKEMFGENIGAKVIADYAEALGEQRAAGDLAVLKGSGIIVSANSPDSIPVRSNTFHGDR